MRGKKSITQFLQHSQLNIILNLNRKMTLEQDLIEIKELLNTINHKEKNEEIPINANSSIWPSRLHCSSKSSTGLDVHERMERREA